MRTRNAVLSCAVVAMAGWLAAPVAMAGGRSHDHHGGSGGGGATPTPAPTAPPTSCTIGCYQVTVTAGPSFVSCTSPSGQCTEIEYTVTGGVPDHVAAVEGVGIQYVDGPGNQWYQACGGDPVTGLGENACHEQAAKFNPTSSVQKFKIGLDGQRASGPTTVAIKKGSDVGECRILGIGLDGVASLFQSTQKKETINFKGCAMTFTRDAATGAVLNVAFDPSQSTKPSCSASGADPMACCSDLITTNVDKVNLSVDGLDLGFGQLGDGYLATGNNSCTTRIIGGRVYTWGSPCP
jgi:hypothetical protein